MRFLLLTLVCAAVAAAAARAQAPDLSAIERARVAGDTFDEAAAAELMRRLGAPRRLLTFSEFRGTWLLDAKTTPGIRYAQGRDGSQAPFNALGMEIARRIVITGTDTAIVLTRDDGPPEPYGFDGTERQAAVPPSGAAGLPRYSFALVAGALALTARTTTCCDAERRSSTAVLTDAYSLTAFDVMRVQRHVSMLREPPGSLVTPAPGWARPVTITYRRAP